MVATSARCSDGIPDTGRPHYPAEGPARERATLCPEHGERVQARTVKGHSRTLAQASGPYIHPNCFRLIPSFQIFVM
jgi:hypothetical protein